ncbi:MAG: hypothetical protein GXP45_07445 [bacterium]|nr:hypothetical protein [bacterium]
MEKRIQENETFLQNIKFPLKFVEKPKGRKAKIKQFWRNPYQDYYKFFGGGEVLNEERPFPYDGWNLYFGYHLWKSKSLFSLLGGI